MENKNKRNSKLGLIRIVSMIMIIAHHICLYGVLRDNSAGTFWFQGYLVNRVIVLHY